MNKGIVFLSVAFFVMPFMSAMDIAIPAHSSSEVVVVSAQQRPATPRGAIYRCNTPVKEACLLGAMINCQLYDKAMKTLSDPKILPSYGPAFVLRNIIEGDIRNDSPLYSREQWNAFHLPGIDKKSFLSCAIYMAQELEKSCQDSDMDLAEKYFMSTRHFQRLQKEEHVSEFIEVLKSCDYLSALKMIGKSEYISDNKIVVILNELISHKMTKMSPFYNKRAWGKYVPVCGITKETLLSMALYIAEKRKLYYQKRNNAKRCSYYISLERHLLSL